MTDFETELQVFNKDVQRQTNFISTSRETGKRTFPFFNTNVKTLQTLCSYILNMYDIDSYPQDKAGKDDIHQKNSIVEEFNFRSISNHNDETAICRSNIIKKSVDYFEQPDHSFVQFLLYILLLSIDCDKNIKNCALDFLNSVPKLIKRNIYFFVDEILDNKSMVEDNLLQDLIILYGDEKLFKSYIKDIENYYPDKEKITTSFIQEYNKPNNCIANRVRNIQLSAFKKEAYFICTFFTLNEFINYKKLFGFSSGNKIHEAEAFCIEFLEYFEGKYTNSYKLLGITSQETNLNTLKCFIQTELNKEEKIQLFSCIQKCFQLEMPSD